MTESVGDGSTGALTGPWGPREGTRATTSITETPADVASRSAFAFSYSAATSSTAATSASGMNLPPNAPK